MQVLGIDVGGSGIKGAIVNSNTGKLLTPRIRYVTPQPTTPRAVARTIAQIVKDLKWKGKMGVGFPAVVKNNIVRTASNVSNSWIGTNGVKVISRKTGCAVTLLNDADAAALAEYQFGGKKPNDGMILFITVGTGLGTALIYKGQLLPNTELGHIQLKKTGNAEWYASDAARKRNHLSWKSWAGRFNKYLKEMEFLFWPDLFIIGGGASKLPQEFVPYLKIRTPIRMAVLQNEAGIIGAALAASLNQAKT